MFHKNACVTRRRSIPAISQYLDNCANTWHAVHHQNSLRRAFSTVLCNFAVKPPSLTRALNAVNLGGLACHYNHTWHVHATYGQVDFTYSCTTSQLIT